MRRGVFYSVNSGGMMAFWLVLYLPAFAFKLAGVLLKALGRGCEEIALCLGELIENDRPIAETCWSVREEEAGKLRIVPVKQD